MQRPKNLTGALRNVFDSIRIGIALLRPPDTAESPVPDFTDAVRRAKASAARLDRFLNDLEERNGGTPPGDARASGVRRWFLEEADARFGLLAGILPDLMRPDGFEQDLDLPLPVLVGDGVGRVARNREVFFGYEDLLRPNLRELGRMARDAGVGIRLSLGDSSVRQNDVELCAAFNARKPRQYDVVNVAIETTGEFAAATLPEHLPTALRPVQGGGEAGTGGGRGQLHLVGRRKNR